MCHNNSVYVSLNITIITLCIISPFLQRSLKDKERLRSMPKVIQGISESWDVNPGLGLYSLWTLLFPFDKNEMLSLKNLGQTLLFVLFSKHN